VSSSATPACSPNPGGWTMTSDPLVGRVALVEGRALAGFTVELHLGTTTQSVVTDGAGEFRLEAPGRPPGSSADPPTGEFVVRAPDNQVVFREWYRLDGRYLGLTVPRQALPRGPRRGMRPPQPPEAAALVDGMDVGDQGEVLLPGLRRLGVAPGRRAAGAGNRIAAASGTRVSAWTVDGGGRAAPAEVDVDAEVLDLACDPRTGEIVLLLAGQGPEAVRELAVVAEDGGLERRLSLEGDWSRLAISPDGATVALVAPSSPAWAVAADGDLRIQELESAATDVAFAGHLVVLAAVQELRSLRLGGEVLGRTAWPGQEVALMAGGPGAVFAYDLASGRATRVLADANGKLAADHTILLGRYLPVGWWWDRSWILTLLDDRLQWWRPPSLVTQPSPPHPDITFVGPT
jgi:hypothetical protein